MKVREIIQYFESIAPLELQDDFDNSGLLTGNLDQEAKGATICLDITEDIIKDTIKNNCNLIISHHPIIFTGLKRITGVTPTEKIVIQAIKNDIAIICMHTNLDNIYEGVNGINAYKLGLKNTKVILLQKDILRKLVTFCPVEHSNKVREALFAAGAGSLGNYDSCSFNTKGEGSFKANENSDPFIGTIGEIHFESEIRIETIYPVYKERKILQALFETHPYDEVAYDLYPLANQYNKIGAGMIGELDKAVSEKEFFEFLKKVFNLNLIRHSEFLNKDIRKVAICGGSGSFLIKDAIYAGADVFITGDIKYHQFFEADNKILLADIGHYESEEFAMELIYKLIKKKFPNFALRISDINTNAIHYYL